MIYKSILRAFLNKTFRLWEALGFHITPDDYEQPIPNIGQLPQGLWERRSDLPGIDMNEAGQIELLDLFSNSFKEEYEKLPENKTAVPHEYYRNNGFFEAVDAEILYCTIRHFKPRKIIEVGAGFSTYLSSNAILTNKKAEAGYNCELTSIEPYPNKVIKKGFPGLDKLVTRPVQNISLSDFRSLGANDLLFIDSSHALKIASDVQYEYLEILPRLNKGVLVYIHDIFLPREYPKKWVLKDKRFLNEQYLLQAFLACNNSFKVLWAGQYMHLRHPDKLKSAFSFYNPDKTMPGGFLLVKAA